MDEYKEKYEKEAALRKKNAVIINHMAKWMMLLEDGISICDFFFEKDCKRIAVYGASAIGRVLIKEIERTNDLSVVCIVDKNAERIRKNYYYPVLGVDEYINVENVDMVVVTPIAYYDQIQKDLLRQRPDIPVVNIARIIEVAELEAWDGKTV